MKKIFYLLLMLVFTLTACGDDDYTVEEAYEKAEITAIVLYNKEGKVASDQVTISSEQGAITVELKEGEDKTNLKITASISAGATLTPDMAQGYQDFSTAKTYTVISPGKSVVKQWTLTVQ